MTQKKAAEKTEGDAYMPNHRIKTELREFQKNNAPKTRQDSLKV